MTTTPKQAVAKDCEYHFHCETTQACSHRKCVDLCFSDFFFSQDCDQGVNNARDRFGLTPLHEAALGNRVAVAKLLLAHSANVESTDAWGKTPLHRTAENNCVDVAKVLIENSANVNSTDLWGATALHVAAETNSVDVAKLFIAHSANLNAVPEGHRYKNMTPLQVAIRYRNQEMVQLLRNALRNAA